MENNLHLKINALGFA